MIAAVVATRIADIQQFRSSEYQNQQKKTTFKNSSQINSIASATIFLIICYIVCMNKITECTDKEIAERMEKALRKSLVMPPKPFTPKKEKPNTKPKKSRASSST